MNFLERIHNMDLGHLLVRIAMGIIFIQHGWMKVTGMEGTIGFFDTLGFPAFLAYFVAYLEVIGGAALILGVLTRYAAVLLAITMAVAVFKVHLANGFSVSTGGYEFALVLMLGSLAIAFMGAGAYAIDRLWKRSDVPMM